MLTICSQLRNVKWHAIPCSLAIIQTLIIQILIAHTI